MLNFITFLLPMRRLSGVPNVPQREHVNEPWAGTGGGGARLVFLIVLPLALVRVCLRDASSPRHGHVSGHSLPMVDRMNLFHSNSRFSSTCSGDGVGESESLSLSDGLGGYDVMSMTSCCSKHVFTTMWKSIVSMSPVVDTRCDTRVVALTRTL